MTTKPSAGIKARRLRKLLHRLVDIYSPSGKEEEILHFLCGYLKRHGLPVIMQPVDTNRYNLVVNPSPDAAAAVFVAHVDTVVAYDLDHLGCVEKGDIIGGLGAADMKGGCAAMIEAWISFMEAASSPPPVALALVVGEEEEGDGAQKLVKEYHFPWALIGEPTDLHPCLAHYGYIEVQLTATGRRMHASLANQGRNPVETMLQLLLKISHFLASEHPELVYNIRDLSSARAGFAVPERCNAWLDIHLPPTAPLGEISAEIEEILYREKQLHRKFNASLAALQPLDSTGLPQPFRCKPPLGSWNQTDPARPRSTGKGSCPGRVHFLRPGAVRVADLLRHYEGTDCAGTDSRQPEPGSTVLRRELSS